MQENAKLFPLEQYRGYNIIGRQRGTGYAQLSTGYTQDADAVCIGSRAGDCPAGHAFGLVELAA